MDNRPTLSICIPIYNRRSYLERMLSRFLEDKQLFEEKIQLFISDNCSTEDIKGVCDGFLSDRAGSLCGPPCHGEKSPFLLRPGMLS